MNIEYRRNDSVYLCKRLSKAKPSLEILRFIILRFCGSLFFGSAVQNIFRKTCVNYLALTILGSKVSLNPSPKRLKPNTAQAMATPGKIASQGAAPM